MRSLLAVVLLFASAAPAAAQVTLPSGMVVPVDSMNGEVQLYSFFSSRGEPIDWIADARNEPDTFSPLCDFTAALLLHEAGASLGVGWYNADPAATVAPSASEIYEIVPAGSPLGTTITGSSIRDDARYAGGLIGFAFTDLQCDDGCSTLAGVGGLIGAVVGAVGVAIVAVLTLRAMDEWNTIQARDTDA